MQNILADDCGTTDVRLYQPQGMRARAIKDFCIICMGGSPHNPRVNSAAQNVRECPSTHCPLYLVRPFRSSADDDAENEPEPIDESPSGAA